MLFCHGDLLINGRKVLSYGLPCAMILASAVETGIQDSSKGIELPPSIKVSNLIKNLSIFVSQLENVSSPSKTNHLFCLRASQAITRKLDHILDCFTVTAKSTTPEPESTPSMLSSGPPRTAIGDADISDFVNFDNFDLADWGINFDLDSITGE